MGKWAAALASHLAERPEAADEKLRHSSTGLPSKPSKAPFEPFEGEGVRGSRDFSSRVGSASNDAAPDRSRPDKLAQADADAAHAEPWNDAACARFAARVVLFLRRGIDATDADDIAERLHLRDVQVDDRRLCVECVRLAGRAGAWRCSNHRAAGVGRELPAVLVTTMQRCTGFAGTTP